MAVELLPPGEAHPENPRWHELRRQGVTASEIPIILGLSRWESPWSLWHRKRGLIGEAEAGEGAGWGRRLEQVIADAAAERLDPHGNLRILPAGLYAHSERRWQMATPDRIVYEAIDMDTADSPGAVLAGEPLAILEIKHPHGWDGWGDDGTDDVPAAYLAQCLWQLDVMDLDECWLAAYSRHELRVYEIRRDAEGVDADLAMMRKAAHEFLISEGPPPLDHHPATLAATRALHPSVEERAELIPTELASRYRTARRDLRIATERARQAEAELRVALGAAREAVESDGRPVATRSVYVRRSIDAKRLRSDHPEIAAQYTTTSTVDRLNSRKDTNVETQ